MTHDYKYEHLREEDRNSLIPAFKKTPAEPALETLRLRYEPETKTVRTYPANLCVFYLGKLSLGGATDASLGSVDDLGRLIVRRFNSAAMAEELTKELSAR